MIVSVVIMIISVLVMICSLYVMIGSIVVNFGFVIVMINSVVVLVGSVSAVVMIGSVVLINPNLFKRLFVWFLQDCKIGCIISDNLIRVNCQLDIYFIAFIFLRRTIKL